jgi:hypothetical protein
MPEAPAQRRLGGVSAHSRSPRLNGSRRPVRPSVEVAHAGLCTPLRNGMGSSISSDGAKFSSPKTRGLWGHYYPVRAGELFERG